MFVAHAAFACLRCMGYTWRLQLNGFDAWDNQGPHVIALWHQDILAMVHLLRTEWYQQPLCAVISGSRDGALLDTIRHKFPNIDVFRVHKKQRHASLHQLKVEKKPLLITPDGPKGPRHRVKPGAIWLAREMGATCWAVTFTMGAWELPTWDSMRLPKIGTTITAHLHKVDVQGGKLQEGQKALEKALTN